MGNRIHARKKTVGPFIAGKEDIVFLFLLFFRDEGKTVSYYLPSLSPFFFPRFRFSHTTLVTRTGVGKEISAEEK